MSESSLATLSIGEIREPKDALRTVKAKAEEYKALVDSIRQNGVLNPISVRPIVEEKTGESFYEVIDGLQRFSASKEAGLETMDCKIMEADDLATYKFQIIGNIHKIETKPVEYSRQLQRIIALDPLLTAAVLAEQLNKSVTWINQRLNLLDLEPSIGKSVDDGDINLSNAYALAKLPPEEQVNWVEDAMTEAPDVFVPKAMERKKEIDKARRAGRAVGEAQFTPKARFQKMADVEAEIESGEVGATLTKSEGVDDVYGAFKLALQWVLGLDAASVATKKQAWEDKRASDKAKREQASKERAGKRAADAQWKADRLKHEAGQIAAGVSGDDLEAALKEWEEKNPKPTDENKSEG